MGFKKLFKAKKGLKLFIFVHKGLFWGFGEFDGFGSEIKVTSANDRMPYIGTSLDEFDGDKINPVAIALYGRANGIGGIVRVVFYKRQVVDQQIMNNPRPFDIFMNSAEVLIETADGSGGKTYKFMAFNVDSNTRTPEQNQQLKKVVERVLKKLQQSGKINDVEYRRETNFILDTKTGAILPYDILC